MIKTVALALLMITFVLTGQYVNSRLKNRVESLKLCILLIESISAEIMYSRKTITDILYDLSRRDDFKKLCFISVFSKESKESFPELWKASVSSLGSKNDFKHDDKELLRSFGSSLGITDTDGQIGNCNLHIKMFEKQLKNAEKTLNDKSKVNTAISFLLGTVTVVLLY